MAQTVGQPGNLDNDTRIGIDPPASPWSPFTQGTLAGYKNSQTGQWLPGDHPEAAKQGLAPINVQTGQAAGPAPTAAPGTGAAAGQPTTQQNVLQGTAIAGNQIQQGTPTTVAGAFQQALINRMTPQDITSSNPAIKGSIEANRNAETRGLSRTQEALAERAAATGQTGAQETGLRQAIGESAGRQGAFEGNALFGLHQQQAGELSQALGLGAELLSDQQRQDLQRYGIDLDATLRREGLGAQTQLGNRELDIRDSLGKGNLGLGYAGLLQGGDQFRQGLGAQLGLGQANLNLQAMLGLLGGL
jgi:hypothetical protein